MLDKDILLSTSLSDKISEIGNLFFNYNRILDAGMDYMDVDWNMNKLGNYIHQNMAHKSPIDADAFRDFNAQNSRRTNYGVDILGNNAEYESPLGFFAFGIAYAMKIMKAISEGIDMAMAEKDYDVCEFLKSQISVPRWYKAQFVLLYDKCSSALSAGNTWQDIDNRWEDFVVPLGV